MFINDQIKNSVILALKVFPTFINVILFSGTTTKYRRISLKIRVTWRAKNYLKIGKFKGQSDSTVPYKEYCTYVWVMWSRYLFPPAMWAKSPNHVITIFSRVKQMWPHQEPSQRERWIDRTGTCSYCLHPSPLSKKEVNQAWKEMREPYLATHLFTSLSIKYQFQKR